MKLVAKIQAVDDDGLKQDSSSKSGELQMDLKDILEVEEMGLGDYL